MTNHAANTGDFGHVRDRLQLELEKPVIERTKLRKVMLAGAVDQRVLVDPAHAGGVWSQRGAGPGRQFALHLIEVFNDPRARPVGIGLVVEQHVHERIAEERIATHGFRAGDAQHRGGERVRDQVLDHLGRLAGVRRANDHLGVRQVG